MAGALEPPAREPEPKPLGAGEGGTLGKPAAEVKEGRAALKRY